MFVIDDVVQSRLVFVCSDDGDCSGSSSVAVKVRSVGVDVVFCVKVVKVV